MAKNMHNIKIKLINLSKLVIDESARKINNRSL